MYGICLDNENRYVCANSRPVERAHVSRRSTIPTQSNARSFPLLRDTTTATPPPARKAAPTPVTASTATRGLIVRLIGTSAGRILASTAVRATTASPRTIARAPTVS